MDANGKMRSPWYDEYIQDHKMTESAVARELDINYDLSVEGIIFKEFQEMHILRGVYKINPEFPVIRVHDYGGCAATNFFQKTNYGQMIQCRELVILEDCNANKLAQRVQAISNDMCREAGADLRFVDYDDPAGENDKWVSGTSSAQIMHQYGIFPTHGRIAATGNRRTARIEHIHFYFATLTEDGPALMIHESCKWTIEALQSGYRHPEGPDGSIDIDDVDEMHPYEDVIDNLGNCLLEEMGISRPGERKPHKPKPVRRDKYTGRIIR